MPAQPAWGDPLAMAMGWLGVVAAPAQPAPDETVAGCAKRLHRLGVGAPDAPQVCFYCGASLDAQRV